MQDPLICTSDVLAVKETAIFVRMVHRDVKKV